MLDALISVFWGIIIVGVAFFSWFGLTSLLGKGTYPQEDTHPSERDLLRRLAAGEALSAEELQRGLVLGQLLTARRLHSLVAWVGGALSVLCLVVVLFGVDWANYYLRQKIRVIPTVTAAVMEEALRASVDPKAPADIKAEALKILSSAGVQIPIDPTMMKLAQEALTAPDATPEEKAGAQEYLRKVGKLK